MRRATGLAYAIGLPRKVFPRQNRCDAVQFGSVLADTAPLLMTRKRRFLTTHDDTNEDISPSSFFSGSSNKAERRFDDLKELHPALREALGKAGLRVMTDVQIETFGPVRAGKDVTARARTGTGKTLAFLLPSIERILRRPNEAVSTINNTQSDEKNKSDDNTNYTYQIQPNDKICMLILSPTRELAQQIHTEAKRLTISLRPNVTTQVVYGGVPKFVDIQRLQSQIPTILTATPGRLLDHLESTILATPASNGSSPLTDGGGSVPERAARDDETDADETSADDKPFRNLLSDVQIMVLDEMDSLLDMGFRPAIRQILKLLPVDRQTLLFSATASPAVQQMMRECVRLQNVVAIDCVDEDEDPSAVTNAQISQSYVVLPADQVVWRIVQIIMDLSKKHNHKVLVFFPTTAQVSFFSRLFQGMGQSVLEMHAQLSQGRRSVVSDRFRHSRKAVLFTTDVSARGVDYPHVTHVVQVGAPPTRETYIHRLGRTGRAGRCGEGILVLTPAETQVLTDELQGLALKTHEEFQKKIEQPLSRRIEDEKMNVKLKMRDRQWPLLEDDAEQVYQALLGYYSSRIRRWTKGNWEDEVVQLATEYCRQAGLTEMPNLNPRLADQLGLTNHPGVVVRDRWASGRAFDVGLRQETTSVDDIWSKPPWRSKSLHRERLTNSSGLWEEELDS